MECAGAHLLRGACIGPAVIRCGSCGALYYCSQKHQKAHWVEEHAEACARMAEQMQRAPILNDFPFSFTRQTTYMVDMGLVTACSFLESCGVHGQGLWKSVCDCRFAKSFGIGVEMEGWHLPSSLCPCKEPETPLEYFLTDWASYYEWRHLPLESPVALLLQWPLSLFYALCLLQSQNGVAFPFGDNQILRIHYLGPERELSQLPVFGELLALLPGLQIYIDFIGPSVPISREGESLKLDGYAKCLDNDCQCKKKASSLGNPRLELQGDKMAVSSSQGQIYLRFWTGLYHDRHSELGALPHLIFAANAGIAAFPSWRPTIELIETLQVPAFFTDYCEEAAFLASQSVAALMQRSQVSFDVQVNPFRQPLAPSNKELDLPTFSNGFIFGFS
ncbi:unnamed protein product [Sphagnum troendelagicum]|uniref:MYND-type domain-containing protein n=1 Tax=Sphagnum troendelagicum TaxID=128251 RepID=A0ABP0U5B7_9BRYO